MKPLEGKSRQGGRVSREKDSEPFKGLAMTLEFVRFQALGLVMIYMGLYGDVPNTEIWKCWPDSRKFVDRGLS